MTSSAFSLSSLYPSEAFSIKSGEPVIGGLHGNTRHYFCGHCMSWLFTRPEGMDNICQCSLNVARGFSNLQTIY